MMTNRLLLTTAISACLLLVFPAMANEPAALCDQFAASPTDASRPASVPGVPYADIVVADAEAPCRAAWEASSEPRIGFQLARVLASDGRIEEALELYVTAVAAGHVEAKVGLAQSLIDVARKQALDLNREAAAEGSVNGLYNMGVFARDDDGDAQQALAMFGQAAERGDAEAAYNMGVLYDEGELLVRDTKQAAKFYEQAVAGNYTWAKVNLAYLLLEAPVEPAERTRALELFRSAAIDDGDTNAGLQLGIMLQDGTEAEQAESQTLVVAALVARDFELARFLQQDTTGLSERNLQAIYTELGVTTLDEAVAKLPAYFASQP